MTRSAGSGSLWLNSDTGFIAINNVNTGSFATSGVDINASYSIDVGKARRLSFDLVGAYLIDFLVEEVDCPANGLDQRQHPSSRL